MISNMELKLTVIIDISTHKALNKCKYI